MMIHDKVHVISGGIHKDLRGILRYFNDFNMDSVKRFYTLENSSKGTVRAWQGHKKEHKWFYVVSGTFKIVLIKPDNWNTPSVKLDYEEFILNLNDNVILNVPAGYASGFQSLETGSKLVVFSDFSLEDSLRDDFKFDKNLWYKW